MVERIVKVGVGRGSLYSRKCWNFISGNAEFGCILITYRQNFTFVTACKGTLYRYQLKIPHSAARQRETPAVNAI